MLYVDVNCLSSLLNITILLKL